MAEVKGEYAGALFSLAKEEKVVDEILSDIKGLYEILSGNTDYIKLMSAPNIKKEERLNLLDEAFRGKVHPYTLNFMKILIEHGYFSVFSDCCREFVKAYNKDNNIEVVTVISPVALNEAQKEKLSKNLGAKLNKNIELHEKTDASLIGGIKIEMQGEMIDGSIKSRLNEIKELLGSTVL